MPTAVPAAADTTSRWRAWAALDRRVWQMAVARAVNTMGLSLVMAFLGVYLVDQRGYPAWQYGVSALGANVGQSLANAWAGNLSDRHGRRPFITGALAVRAFVIAGLGTQVLLDAPLWSITINLVVSSSLRGCFEPVAYALVADVSADDQRIDAFGLQRMGTNLGWSVGPALGGLLAHFMPYGAVFYVASIGLLAAAWVTTRVVDPRATGAGAGAGEAGADRGGGLGAAVAEAFRQPVVLVLLIGTFLAAVLQTQLFSTLAIFESDRVGLSKASIGLIYTVNGVTVLALQLAALRVIRRLGIGASLVGASLVYALGFFLIGAAVGGGVAGGAMAVTVITLAEIVFTPAQQAAIAEVADPDRRGRAYGVVGMAQILGVACGPLVGGVLLDTIGGRPVLLWAAIASLGLVMAAIFGLFRRLQRR